MRAPAGISAYLLLIQIPDDVPAKAVEDGLSTQVPGVQVGDLHGFPGTWRLREGTPEVVTI